jgi:hypothetical protein
MIDAIKSLLGLGPKVDYKELVKNGAIIVDVRSKGGIKVDTSRDPSIFPWIRWATIWPS